MNEMLVIDPEFKNFIDPLSQEEFAQLEENLLVDGCRDALVVWQPDSEQPPILVDGHHRYTICKKHNIPYRIEAKEFADRDAVKRWIILNQLGRRNLVPARRTYYIGLLYRETKKEQGAPVGNANAAKQSAQNGNFVKTAEVIADQFGIGKNTVIRAEKFADAVDTIADTYGEEVKTAILSGSVKGSQKAITESATRPYSCLYSSESPEWYTPKNIIDAVLDMFGEIDLDPCSNATGEDANVPAKMHFTETDDGLSRAWSGKVYMNPPYGRIVAKWVEKLIHEYFEGDVTEAIALIAARTDTQWFNRLGKGGFMWCAIEGRVLFSGPAARGNTAPFPSAIFYLGPNEQEFYHAFKHLGPVYKAIDEMEMIQG